MKKAIIKVIKQKIEDNEAEFASMYIVEQYQVTREGAPADEAEIAKARLKMKECEERITWLKTLLKKESKSSE